MSCDVMFAGVDMAGRIVFSFPLVWDRGREGGIQSGRIQGGRRKGGERKGCVCVASVK